MKFIKLLIFGLLVVSTFSFSSVFAKEVTGSVTVTVIQDQDVTATLTADLYTIDYNTSTVLHISSLNATSCTLSSGGTTLATKTSSSWDVVTNNLISTTKYDLNCKNSTKSASDTKTITVRPAAVCTVASDTNYNVSSCAGTCKNGADNYSVCTTKGGVCINGKTNSPACDDSILCPSPTTRNVQVACDLNSNGDAATSGSVTRSQTKVSPSCTFGEPVTNSNSTYVSDNCVYPVSSCPNPTTRNVQVACDLNSNGDAATSGSVTRSQTKVSPSCTFDEPVTSSNSTYVGDSCVYPDSSSNSCWNGAANYPTCTVDGGGKCLNNAANPPLCTVDGNGKCLLFGAINPPICDAFQPPSNPQVMDMKVTYQGRNIRIGNTNITEKIPYNSKVVVSWSSSDSDSCMLSYSDSKGSGDIIDSLGTTYPSPGLKRDTNYTVTCRGYDGNQNSDSIKVIVSPINAGYVEH